MFYPNIIKGFPFLLLYNLYLTTKLNMSFDILSNCLHNIDQDLKSFEELFEGGNAAAVYFSHTGKCCSSIAHQLLPPESDAEVGRNDMIGWYENDVIVRTYLTSVIFIL